MTCAVLCGIRHVDWDRHPTAGLRDSDRDGKGATGRLLARGAMALEGSIEISGVWASYA